MQKKEHAGTWSHTSENEEKRGNWRKGARKVSTHVDPWRRAVEVQEDEALAAAGEVGEHPKQVGLPIPFPARLLLPHGAVHHLLLFIVVLFFFSMLPPLLWLQQILHGIPLLCLFWRERNR
jgi:hypothetical protein